MNFIVLFVLLGINGAAALRERAVIANDRAQGRLVEGSALTCRDLYGRAFPSDSIRQRDLMIAIGCTGEGANVAIARVQRGEVESTVVDSLVAHLAGTPRDTVSKKRP
jgi:hypothetical protein